VFTIVPLEKCIIGVLHENSHLHLGPVRFVKSQYVDEFHFSIIYTLYLNRAGTTLAFREEGGNK
jgi:hypothetical protein